MAPSNKTSVNDLIVVYPERAQRLVGSERITRLVSVLRPFESSAQRLDCCGTLLACMPLFLTVFSVDNWPERQPVVLLTLCIVIEHLTVIPHVIAGGQRIPAIQKLNGHACVTRSPVLELL